MSTGRDLCALPKGHLHLHLELSMRPSTLAELAAAYGLPAPPTRGFDDFAGFTRIVQGAMSVLRSPADFTRLVDEVVEDAALDGCTYVEPAFWPTQHRGVFGSDEAAWEHVLAAGREAGERHGIAVRWMAPIDRILDSVESAVELTKLAVRYAPDGIVSVGLHNDEVGAPPEPFAPAFALAKDAGLLSTPHAGELEGPHFVTGSLDALQADRIQHGIRSVEQPGLPERLAELGTCLDICPTSNVMLNVVSGLDAHPLPQLLADGVKVSINADDSLCFGPGILEEYELSRRAFDLTDEQLADIARTSVTAGAAPVGVVASSLAGIDAWLGEPAG